MRAQVTYPKLEVHENNQQKLEEEDLRQIYQQYFVQEIQLQGHYAFITFKNIEDAQKALDETNGKNLKHAYLCVQIMQCFICGKQGDWVKNCANRPPNSPNNFQQRSNSIIRNRNVSQSSNSSSQSSQSSQELRKKRNKNKEEQKNQSDSDDSLF